MAPSGVWEKRVVAEVGVLEAESEGLGLRRAVKSYHRSNHKNPE